MSLDEASAREILDRSHAAWSRGDVDTALSFYVDDLLYWSNCGGPDGTALAISGKKGFRTFLQSIANVAECISVSEYFRLINGIGRAKIECCIRHKQTGHTLVGSYRQLLAFHGDKIVQLTEYHDAARMAAFWRLIAGEPIKLDGHWTDADTYDDAIALIEPHEDIAR